MKCWRCDGETGTVFRKHSDDGECIVELRRRISAIEAREHTREERGVGDPLPEERATAGMTDERARVIGLIRYVIDDMRRFGEPTLRMFQLLGAVTTGFTREELEHTQPVEVERG